MEERLQKIIARAGIASRRRAEELIRSGQVSVNGRRVTQAGSKADAGRDHIKVAGKLLRPARREMIYLALNKPAGVVATMRDPEGRRSLRDFLRGVPGRVFPAGRLEYHASGLVFLTNDGEIANQILRAHNLLQMYHIKLEASLTRAEMEELAQRTGVRLRPLRSLPQGWFEAELSEARRDRLRRELFRIGHRVEKIKRVKLGELELGPLEAGEYRMLTAEETERLRRAVRRATRNDRRTAANARNGAMRRNARRTGRDAAIPIPTSEGRTSE